MMKNKKAQAAMEFLMTYGWAILLVLAAIAMLVYFFKPQDLAAHKCLISNKIMCGDYALTSNSLQIQLTNAAGGSINVTEVALLSLEDASLCTDSTSTVIANGQADTFSLATCNTGANAGDVFRGKIQVTYTDTASGIEHVEKGEIIKKISS
jgi:hypothetical protein